MICKRITTATSPFIEFNKGTMYIVQWHTAQPELDLICELELCNKTASNTLLFAGCDHTLFR